MLIGVLISAGKPVSHLDHDRKVTDLSGKLLRIATVDSVLEGGRELASIGDMSLSAFGGHDLSLLCEFVARRNLRLEQLHALVSNAELVPANRRRPVVAIEKDSCANVGKTPLQQAIGLKDGVERFNMRVDGELQQRVCRLVFRRLTK